MKYLFLLLFAFVIVTGTTAFTSNEIESNAIAGACWRTSSPNPMQSYFHVDNADGTTTTILMHSSLPTSFYVKKYGGGASKCIEE